MGGFSSGRYGGKHTTNQMDALDIRRVHQAGRLEPGGSCTWMWTRASGTVSRICMDAGHDGVTLVYAITDQSGERQEYRRYVAVGWSACNFGGKRPWWVCPDCGKRVAILYGGRKYACRHCHDLTYKSTRTAPGSKHYARANKVRMKLGWGGGVASPMGERPKGMHWKTYLRLLNQLSCHGMAALPSTNKLVEKINARLGR